MNSRQSLFREQSEFLRSIARQVEEFNEKPGAKVEMAFLARIIRDCADEAAAEAELGRQ